MRGIQFLTAVLVVLALTAGSAQAQTWTWTGAGDGSDWSDPDNWDTPPGDANIPGIGDYVGDNVEIGIDNVTVDLGATDVTIGQFRTKHRDTDNVTVQGTGTITATEIFNSDKCGNLNFHPNLIVSGRIYNHNKGDIDNFYGTVTADSLDLGASSPLFHKAVTITNVDGLEAFYRTIRTGGNNNWRFDDVLNASKVRIWSDVVGQTSTIAAQDANTLSGVTGAVTVEGGGILNLVAAQNTFPGAGIQINASGLLIGDTGEATWGVGGANINVAENAVLGTSAGTTPTEADLGLAAGVKDALVWQGILADGTLAVGDDGNSAYKGMAFGSFTEGQYNGKTLQAPVGAGDLTLAWLPGSPSATSGSMTLESLDQTGEADIQAFTTMSFNGGQWNASAAANDADAVRTFNIASQLASTATIADFDQANDFTIADDQTFNFSGAGIVELGPTTTHGKVTFSDETMLRVTGQFNDIGTDPNLQLTFNAGSALSIGSGDVLALEQMSPNQLVVDPGAHLTLETGGSWWNQGNPPAFSPQFDITDANNPNLVAFMKATDVTVSGGNNNYAWMQGDGIQLGDGKYLMCMNTSHKGLHMLADPNTNAMIRGAGPGTTMGVANMDGSASGYFEVIIPIDANGGTVVLNSDSDLTAVKNGNTRRTGASGIELLEMSGPIHNAAEVVVAHGDVRISDDAVDQGTLVGSLLPIRVEDTGDLSFQHSADVDGFVVTALDNTELTIDQGGRVYVDGNMTVNSIVLNSTYAADADGLQINDAADILTITGTLSGDGEWGDSGQVVIADDAVIAPGDGIGTLTGTNLILESGAIYEWEIVDPDANAGVGWDLAWASLLDFDAEDADIGALTFRIVDAGLTDDLKADDEFIVAAGNFDIPADWTVTFEPPTGWDVSAAQLALGAPFDVDGDGDTENTLRLTGVASVSTLGTLAWSAGADGPWGADVPGNWALVGEWQGPGSEPNYPNDPYIAAVVDTHWTVNVQDANQQAYTLEVRGGGQVDVKAGRVLTLTRGATVEADGALTVGGTLNAVELLSEGTTQVLAGGAVAVGTLTVSGGSLNLAEDVQATNVEFTGGTLDTAPDKAIVVSGTLTTPDAIVTSDAPSFQAMGSGQPGEITVGMTEDGSTTTVTPAAGAGGTLNAPDLSFQSSPPDMGLAGLHFDADQAVVGDLAFVSDGGISLSGAPDVSVRNLSGAGLLVGDVSVRGAVRPGAVADSSMEVFGSVKLEAGAALQPEVQGPDTLGMLYLDGALDLMADNDAIGPSWVPGADASSMFGGRYVVLDAFEKTVGEFATRGGGNIGAAYIDSVEYNAELDSGGWGIAVTLHTQLDGDVDLDGEVARGDVLALRRAFGSADADWFDGDLNFDGDVNYLDYIAVKRSMGNSVPAGVGITPEPATLALLALGALAGLRKRRRKRH